MLKSLRLSTVWMNCVQYSSPIVHFRLTASRVEEDHNRRADSEPIWVVPYGLQWLHGTSHDNIETAKTAFSEGGKSVTQTCYTFNSHHVTITVRAWLFLSNLLSDSYLFSVSCWFLLHDFVAWGRKWNEDQQDPAVPKDSDVAGFPNKNMLCIIDCAMETGLQHETIARWKWTGKPSQWLWSECELRSRSLRTTSQKELMRSAQQKIPNTRLRPS